METNGKKKKKLVGLTDILHAPEFSNGNINYSLRQDPDSSEAEDTDDDQETEEETEEEEEEAGQGQLSKPTPNSTSLYQEDEEEDSILQYVLRESLITYSKESSSSSSSLLLPAPAPAPLVVDVKQKAVVSNSLVSIPNSVFNGRDFERGESSSATYISCSICKDVRPRNRSESSIVPNGVCDHHYCRECIPVYLGEQIKDSVDIKTVTCPEPNCGKKFCYEKYVPDEVSHLLRRAAMEHSALLNRKFIKCPFEDECGRSFMDDMRGFLIRACPYCWRVFCMKCRVRWHLGMSCEEFQGDLMLERIRRRLQTQLHLQNMLSRGMIIFYQ